MLEKSSLALAESMGGLKPRISALREFGGGVLSIREMLCLLTKSSLLQNSELDGREVLKTSGELGGRGSLMVGSSL